MLSIIIVNYNVEHFLELCLTSVFKAVEGINAEIWVVDNHSSDGSVEMVRKKFPDVQLIANKENTGFSKANNQAIIKSKGQYVLLLNPDTIVPENGLKDALKFMEETPEAGALGARMIDGSGNFLPESKRGLPTPWVSFCKAFGLGYIFPNSPVFSRYHLSYLSEDETHEVDVLSGAFMLLRRIALDKSGLLDEQFFMYGEDVDLSYRIQLAGFKNYYYPETTIIHFKGESTKRGSLSFVRHFYKAMLLFSRKHFSNSLLFSVFIYFGIALRAVLSLVQRFFRVFGGVILEFVVAFLGMVIIKNWWELNFKGIPGMYPYIFIELLVPGYLLIWLVSIRIIGRYSESYGHSAIIRGIVVGTIIISGLTNFFDDYRFSKGLILIGAAWTYLITTTRYILGLWFVQRSASLKLPRRKRVLVVGNATDFERANGLLKSFDEQLVISGWIGENLPNIASENYLGSLEQLPHLSRVIGLNDILFCFPQFSVASAIRVMESQSNLNLQYAFLARESQFIVSSGEKHDRGTVYQSENIPKILLPFNRRLKRLVDLVGCFLVVFLWPVSLANGGNSSKLIRNFLDVLWARKSWIGLTSNRLKSHGLKEAVIRTSDLAGKNASPELIQALDRIYIEEFYPLQEWWNMVKNPGALGR